MGVFKSFKSFCNKACKQFMVDNPGCVVRSENSASLLAIAIECNIMSGFRKCGIHPLNPGVIDDRQTAPSQAVCGGVVQSELQEPSSPGVSSSNSAGSAHGSGLTTNSSDNIRV